MFEFIITDVFNFDGISLLVGKGNAPLYDGKIKCDDIELDVKSSFGNHKGNLDKLSLEVINGKTDKSLIGKTFKSVA